MCEAQIHYAVYLPGEEAELIDALLAEANALAAREPSERDTTLLIAPNTLADFLDFNDFTARAERRLARAGFDGLFQLASFHPHFQFAGTEADDITNATNRAPYPTLHLLREDSVSRAVDAFPDAEAIFGRNIADARSARCRRLGGAGRRPGRSGAMNKAAAKPRRPKPNCRASCARASRSSC